MLNGNFRGQRLGSGTDVWQMSEDVRAGKMKLADFFEAEACMSRSAGHCMTMGTASTMACMVEALGMGLPHNAAIPAVDSRRYVLAQLAGRRIVEMVKEDLRISKILTRQAFENAIRVNAAIGGSTNCGHAPAGDRGTRGRAADLDDWDRAGPRRPDAGGHLMPSGRFLMEDFYYAGGLPAVVRELGEHGDSSRRAHRERQDHLAKICRRAECWNREVIRTFEQPLGRTRRHRGVCAATWRPTGR